MHVSAWLQNKHDGDPNRHVRSYNSILAFTVLKTNVASIHYKYGPSQVKTVRTIYMQQRLWQACAQYTMPCSHVRVFAGV